jgi:amidase
MKRLIGVMTVLILLLSTVPALAFHTDTVTPGAFCAADHEGRTGVTSTGLLMRCTRTSTDDRLRWRQAGPAPAPAPVGDVFTDVLPGGTHTAAIEAMAAEGIISGYADGTFRPNRDVTRGQMASLLYRALDFPDGTASFSDTEGTTHVAAIGALAQAEVIQGFSDGTFRPDRPIRRDQMASMLSKAFDLPAGSTGTFSDITGNTHAPGINAIARAGITTGYPDGTFRPQRSTPRAQTATFLARALERS